MTKILVLMLMTVVFVVGCGNDEPIAPAPAAADGVIMPLAVNNKWVYDVMQYDIGGMLVDEWTDSLILEDSGTVTTDIWFVDDGDSYYANRADGLWFRAASGGSVSLLFKYPANVNDVWPGSGYAMLLESKTAATSVPLGSYTCYQYVREYPSGTGLGMEFYYLVPDTGIVRYEKRDSSNGFVEEIGLLREVILQDQ